jgi:hypothetical protein
MNVIAAGIFFNQNKFCFYPIVFRGKYSFCVKFGITIWDKRSHVKIAVYGVLSNPELLRAKAQ